MRCRFVDAAIACQLIRFSCRFRGRDTLSFFSRFHAEGCLLFTLLDAMLLLFFMLLPPCHMPCFAICLRVVAIRFMERLRFHFSLMLFFQMLIAMPRRDATTNTAYSPVVYQVAWHTAYTVNCVVSVTS